MLVPAVNRRHCCTDNSIPRYSGHREVQVGANTPAVGTLGANPGATLASLDLCIIMEPVTTEIILMLTQRNVSLTMTYCQYLIVHFQMQDVITSET